MTHKFTCYYLTIFFCHFLPPPYYVVFCEWFVADNEATVFEIRLILAKAAWNFSSF